MKKSKNSAKKRRLPLPRLRFAALASALSAASGDALAINVDLLRVSDNQAYPFLESAYLNEQGWAPKWLYPRMTATAQFRTITNPLVQFDTSGTKTVLVSQLTGLDLSFSAQLNERWLAGADLTAYSVSFPAPRSSALDLGDLRLHAKYQILDHRSFVGLALVPELFVPTGSPANFISAGSMGAGLRIAAERSLFGLLGVAANAGFEYYASSSYYGIDQKYQVPLGLGLTLPVFGRLAASASFFTVLLPAGSARVATTDWILSGIWNVGHGWSATAGGSVGGFQSRDSSASFRALLGLKWGAEEAVVLTAPAETCGARVVEYAFQARPAAPEELAGVELPFVAGNGHAVPLLGLGQSTGKDKNGDPFVKGAQSVFAVDLVDLPPRDAVVDLQSMAFGAEIRGLPQEQAEGAADGRSDAGVLCILGIKVCSGDLPRSAQWKGNVNKRFFEGRETPNDFFARRAKSEEEVTRVSLEFVKLLENSLHPGVEALVYADHSTHASLKKKTLLFAVGLDSYLASTPRIVLKLKEDSCWKTRSWTGGKDGP